MTGHHFEIFKQGRRWLWELYGANFPYGPIARSRRDGYASERDARESILSACKASMGACGLRPGQVTPRIVVVTRRPSLDTALAS
jgi:hypothetical protein